VTSVPWRAARGPCQTARVIRNVVIHLLGDQPVVVDLLSRPQASDASLLCLNLRTIDGKRPPSVHEQDSFFVIPLATVRFIEIPARELATHSQPEPTSDEPFGNGHSQAIAPIGLPGPELELEPDEDLLQRIRDV